MSTCIATCCQNGHTTCYKCSDSIARMSPHSPPLCPICRSRLTRATSPPTPWATSDHWRSNVRLSQPPPAVRKLIEVMHNTRVACTYRSHGCLALTYVAYITEHESMCPYSPHVRCMVPYCRWSGAYSDTYRHVSSTHHFSAYDVMENRFIMPDLTFGLRDSTTRMYLIRNTEDENQLYWLAIGRPAESIQLSLIKVADPSSPPHTSSLMPNMVFRVKSMDRNGRLRQRGPQRPVIWDRTVLGLVVSTMGQGGIQDRVLSMINSPPSCIVVVFDEHRYEAVISWNHMWKRLQ